MSGSVIPGWYGKLPTLGDFASRRLDAQWIAIWDGWLADGLAALREASDTWLERYLASPPWRFVLMPGALPGSIGHQASAGVLMASVDRVGRYFPLTLVAPLGTLPRSSGQFDALLGWLRDLEDAAADAMHDDWSIERLDDALGALRCPLEGGSDDVPAAEAELALRRLLDSGEAAVAVAPASQAALMQLFTDATIVHGHAAAAGASFWLAATEDPPRLLMSRGLPAGRQFAALFGAGPNAVP